MYTCIYLLYYIISIYHSISVNKVKSVSKNPKGNKCDKGHSWKPFYIIVIIIFLIISSNIFKISLFTKNTTKHADKIKYNTIFIVSPKKFVLFQRLCHLHHSLHCTYDFVFCYLIFLKLFFLLFFQVWMYHSKTLHPRWTWDNRMTLFTPPVVLIGNVFGFSVQQPNWFGDLIL